MQSPPFVSIIILNWNSEKYLPICLNALLAQTQKKFDIVLLDNGSTDENFLGLAEKFPDLDLTLKA